MYALTRRLFLSQIVLLAGCHSAPVSAKPLKGDVTISHLARLYSMKLSKTEKRLVLKNKWNTLAFERGSRRVYINEVLYWLHRPIFKKGFDWVLHEVDFAQGIDPIMRSAIHLPADKVKVVVLDPGHGGKDPGASGATGLREKDVVLAIAKLVKANLEAQRIKVYLTRESDVYPQLSERCAFAAKKKADLFISIHADGAATAEAHGVETFIATAAGCDSTSEFDGVGGDSEVYPGNLHNVANSVLGFSLQSNLVKQSQRSDRGVRRARYSVIKRAPCPAALVECGFLTNLEEEKLLSSASYRTAVARGISNGILGYSTLAKRARG